jgi:hypothetical protein
VSQYTASEDNNNNNSNIDNKLHFHDHIKYIFSQCIKLLGRVRSGTFNFSSLECMARLYITLIKSELEYASVVWNSITSTDANKLERIQQMFVALCFNSFFPQFHYCYSLYFGGVRIADSSYEEVSSRCSLSYSSLLWFEILPFRFGTCWPPCSCSVYQRFCIVQYLLLM